MVSWRPGGVLAPYFGMRRIGPWTEDPAGRQSDVRDPSGRQHRLLVYATPPDRSLRGRMEAALPFLYATECPGIASASRASVWRGAFAFQFTGLRSASPRCPLRQQAGGACEIPKRNPQGRLLSQLRLSPRAALRLCRSAARILVVASARSGSPHGDLSPWRIWASHDASEVRLLAYGLPSPHLLGQGRGGRALANTLRYSPPERLRGAAPTARGDVYALAAIGLELLTGRPLIAGNDVHDLRARILGGGATAAARRVRLPEPVRDVFAHALVVVPEGRPEPAAFRAALTRALRGSGAAEPVALHHAPDLPA